MKIKSWLSQYHRLSPAGTTFPEFAGERARQLAPATQSRRVTAQAVILARWRAASHIGEAVP
jgi:hypothetical protein